MLHLAGSCSPRLPAPSAGDRPDLHHDVLQPLTRSPPPTTRLLSQLQELVNGKEIFEHLFVNVENEVVAELVTVEKEVGVL